MTSGWLSANFGMILTYNLARLWCLCYRHGLRPLPSETRASVGCRSGPGGHRDHPESGMTLVARLDMNSGIYEDLVLGAQDVCSNCFRRVRVERVDPVMARDGLRHELDSHYSRRRRTTTVEHHYSTPAPPQSQATFCACGVESARHRIWDADDVDRDHFQNMLKHVVATLEAKGVSFDRVRFAGHALQRFDDGDPPDAALAGAIDLAVVAETL